MSNSSRIEVSTRQHVNATLTSKMITELVRVSFPEFAGGVYASDAAYKRNEDGVLVPRGAMAYGDGILEAVGKDAFRVLPTEEIVRMPRKRVAKAAVAPAAEAPVTPVGAAVEPAQKKAKSKSESKKKKSAAA